MIDASATHVYLFVSSTVYKFRRR